MFHICSHCQQKCIESQNRVVHYYRADLIENNRFIISTTYSVANNTTSTSAIVPGRHGRRSKVLVLAALVQLEFRGMCTTVFAMCRHVLPQRARLIGVNYSGCSILKSERDSRLNRCRSRHRSRPET